MDWTVYCTSEGYFFFCILILSLSYSVVDPVTGELIFFGYNLTTRPFCRYGVVDKYFNKDSGSHV